MSKELKLYKKTDFNLLKKNKETLGYSIHSITTIVYDFSQIDELDVLDIIDISSLSEFNSKQSLAEQVFPKFDFGREFICDIEKWKLMEYDLRYIFDDVEEINFEAEDIQSILKPANDSGSFKTLYYYEKEWFRNLKHHYLEKGFDIESVSKFYNNLNLITGIDKDKIIIDISSLSDLTKIQFVAEEVFYRINDDVLFICDSLKKETLEYELRFSFKQFKNLEPQIFFSETAEGNIPIPNTPKLKTIIDLTDSQLGVFFDSFNSKLYGHPKFKDDFIDLIKTFRVFNKLGEHRILSLFLMGESGVGKTEVAKLIFECLGGSKRLAKINFGNYSNEFSLSSLIGSARGYIGSEDGEIFMKVRDTDIAVLLIDEFEKSNNALFNFFLEVLESGKMTSSLGKEIDLNGFIIIFTSNISKEEFYSRISPELRSRFDYKGRFTLLESIEKQKYVEFRANSLSKKLDENNPHISDSLRSHLALTVDVKKYNNMRDINKQIKKSFVQFVNNAQISDKER